VAGKRLLGFVKWPILSVFMLARQESRGTCWGNADWEERQKDACQVIVSFGLPDGLVYME
jgi:hypothetical protein